MKVRNIFIIFLVSGFWHGANWTFLFWGFLNAMYILPSVLFKTNRNNLNIVAQGKYLPTLRELFAMVVTFSLTIFAWIFFRSETIENAFRFLSKIFSRSFFSRPEVLPISLLVLLLAFIIIEWIGREQKYAIAAIGSGWPKILRWIFYYLVIMAIFQFSGVEQPFIYFQF